MRLLDLFLLTAIIVEGIVLYWMIKYGDEFKELNENETKRKFMRKWK